MVYIPITSTVQIQTSESAFETLKVNVSFLKIQDPPLSVCLLLSECMRGV